MSSSSSAYMPALLNSRTASGETPWIRNATSLSASVGVRPAERSSRMNSCETPKMRSDELVAVHSPEVLALDLPRKLQRHVVQSHGELLVVIDAAESHIAHRPYELRIGRELEYARAFTVFEIAFAI